MSTTDTTAGQHRRAMSRAPDRGPMVQALLVKSVADRFTLSAVIGLLMIGMGAMIGALWPPLQETFADLPSNLSDAIGKALPGGALTSAVGWVNAELMSVVAPAGVIAVAVISAARATAGEEEDKTLGVLLAAPVSRLSFLAVKAVAMVIHVLVVGVLLAGGLIVGNLIGNLGLTADGVLGATVHTVALGILFGMVALLIGAMTANRRLATAGTGALAGVAFVVSAILPFSDSLADGAKLSPWYYYNASDPLASGADFGHLFVLAAVASIPAVIAAVVFHHRDLRG